MAARAFTVAKGREYLLKRCAFSGLDIFLRDGGKKTLSYYLSFVVPSFYQICCLYTCFILQNEPVTLLKCLSLWGAAGQCSIKIHLAHFHRKNFREKFNFIQQMQQKSENDPEISECFWKMNKTYHFLQKIIFYMYNVTLVLMGSYSLINFFVYGKRKFLVIMNVPGLNPDPEAGFPDYEIQTAVHLVCLFVGINELVALDGIFTYFVLNGAVIADNLIIHVRRMSLLVGQDSLTNSDTAAFIRHLSQLHQEYIGYVNRLDRMYNLMFLMQFGSFALSGSVGLYAARISDWYAVYWIVICNVFQLFFSCALGSIIESKNSLILDELYNTQWTSMNVRNRRMLMFIMQRARTQRGMTVGNISKLNLETGMDIYKILYSYSILLMDAVEA
uniref:Odorant receptor n=1 Tax=Lutzomyia longipalpis TaxID=7200 RepID=A0A3F2ZDC5_LUTLO